MQPAALRRKGIATRSPPPTSPLTAVVYVSTLSSRGAYKRSFLFLVSIPKPKTSSASALGRLIYWYTSTLSFVV